MLLRLKALKNLSRWFKIMLIVGTVSSPQEAREIQEIAKFFVVGNRFREIAKRIRSDIQ